jgi:flagellar motor switch protein FliN/FliY
MSEEGDYGIKSDGSRSEMEAVLDVKLEVTAVLGTADMPISQILKLGRGAVVELDNNQLIAKGEVIVVDDRLGVTVNDVIKSPSGRRKALTGDGSE